MSLCLTLAESSLESLQSKIDLHHRRVDWIEVRLDFLEEAGFPRLPGGGARFVATCRPRREGGQWRRGENDRLDVLRRAAAEGFHWLDVEHDVESLPDCPAGVRIIRSLHRLQGPLVDPAVDLDRLAALPGDMVKLAAAVSGTAELARLLLALEAWPGSKPKVALGMGRFGQASRYLAPWLGNEWTYVSEESGRPAAPGQFDLGSAELCLWPPNLSRSTEIYGVLGRPVGHSLSPALHNGLFRRHGMDRVYLPLELDDAVAWFSYLGRTRLPFRGFSVTLPFKGDAARFAESVLSPVDAVNTLRRTATGWAGSNTDLEGFLRPLRRAAVKLSGKSAVVLGCGGAARSVARALLDEGARVTVAGRDHGKAADFARSLGCEWVGFENVPDRGHLLVNTTPVGQFPDTSRCPVDASRLNFEIVYDLIYHPRETRLLKCARAHGAKTVSGLEMFVEQAALQFETWTGVNPDRPVMLEILQRSLAGD